MYFAKKRCTVYEEAVHEERLKSFAEIENPGCLLLPVVFSYKYLY